MKGVARDRVDRLEMRAGVGAADALVEALLGGIMFMKIRFNSSIEGLENDVLAGTVYAFESVFRGSRKWCRVVDKARYIGTIALQMCLRVLLAEYRS